ncbi:MAG: hypothetical protein KAT48_09185, partial [Bacteroidales bacterium]|nr:hypothetical protein [Bacteroidales bacterium]
MKKVKTKKIGFSFSVLLVSMLIFSISIAGAQNYQYQNNRGKAGFTLQQESRSGVVITFSVDEFSLIEQDINGEMLKTIQLPGAYLPKDEGEPNLPGRGQYVAIPEGATAHLEIISMRTESIEGIDISPSPRLPLITDEPPLHYEKDLSIYGNDAFFPAQPILLSPVTEVRGVDMVILGITPFQWNPVTKELRVIRDIEVKITFDGGTGHFGDDRLRSRFWDPIISDMILNRGSLPEIVYNTINNFRNQDFEYVIITPDNASFVAWADTLRRWRNAQGIRTGVFTLAEIGGNSVGAIESFINNAYNNWNIPPSAVLLMADYGTSGDNCIVSPYWNNYCVSDNIYADVTGNDLPDVVLARITGQTEAQLETMIGKMIAYESDPPTNSNFYDHPVSAGGWQSDRWFILCAEICYGFWEIELNKNPVREYAGYGSGAPSSWSTNPNTQMIIDYFGPNGLGYIPATPSHLTDWGGNATRINNDLNSGAFMILHRDHGNTGGWDSPYYYIGDLSGLNENDLTFVFSINCLTGKYNMGGECFAEAFHRHDYGALGIIAASETSYSFVNDVYTWGMWDDMWPDFDPGYGIPSSTTDWIRPCFSNASGKYYLDASNWPSNPQNKTHTNNLFHHHGDAFLTVYSETPQTLSVTHDDIILPGATSFSVSATNGSLVGLSVDGNFINSGVASGGPLVLSIPDDLETGTILTVTVTKQNYFRYEGYATVIGPPPNASSPIPSNHETNTNPFATLHWNGSADYYKMYLGTDNPPTNITNGEVVNDTMYVPPYYLEFQTEYFWRVESFNNYGSSNGTIWDFTVSSPPDEDFESGDFSAHDWYFDGDAEWVIDNSTTRHGIYAARSGNIAEGQSSSLLIELEAESFFTVPIIFWKKISTLESQNTLQFIIDGNVAGEWSGESDWTKETFMVFAGWHT